MLVGKVPGDLEIKGLYEGKVIAIILNFQSGFLFAYL